MIDHLTGRPPLYDAIRVGVLASSVGAYSDADKLLVEDEVPPKVLLVQLVLLLMDVRHGDVDEPVSMSGMMYLERGISEMTASSTSKSGVLGMEGMS